MATSNTTPVVIPQPIAAQATSENINVIPNGATGTNGASFQEGFPAITRMPVIENPLPTQKSGLPPKQQDFNGLFNVVSQHNFFSQNGGTYSFNQAVSDAIGGYPKNAVLWYFPENEDPFLVYSLINDNTNNFVEDPTLIDDEHWKKLSFGGGGEIGDVMFAPLGIDESLNLRRYLNGQVLIQSQFVSFTNKVKAAIALYPNLATTEENWQAEKTNSKLGQCGKFVVDDTAGTIRLPAVVNAQGLVDLALIGGIKSESLPNITGEADITSQHGLISTISNVTGAFAIGSGNKYPSSFNNTVTNGASLALNASRSSSAYQNNAPVQQEAVQYPYCIVVNTGVEEAERPINNYQVNNVYSYGMSQYYKGTMNNNSWLKSSGQWNAGTVYTGMYNWLLEQMNAGVSGFVASTAAYTDYDFVINTADQTFRLPVLSNRILVEKKEPTDADQYWYNLYSDGWLEQGGVLETSQATTVTFVKPYITTPNVMVTAKSLSTTSVAAAVMTTDVTLASFSVTSGGWDNKGVFTAAAGSVPKVWSAQGYTNIPQNTTWNLYYYIGDTLQNAQLINVARIEEKLTDVNAASRGYVVDSYRNGTEWYRVYSDGWIEQGSMSTVVNGTTGVSFVVNYLTPFSRSDNQMIIMTSFEVDTNDTGSNLTIIGRGTNNFTGVNVGYGRNPLFMSWYACGY